MGTKGCIWVFFGYKNDVIIGFGKEYIRFMINILYLHGVFFFFFRSMFCVTIFSMYNICSKILFCSFMLSSAFFLSSPRNS